MSRPTRSFITRGLILLASMTVLTGQGCPFLPMLGAGESTLEIIQKAAQLAKDQNANAIVFQLQGLYGSTVPGPSLTLEYTFVATDPNSPQISWQLHYDRTTWTVTQINSPFVSVEFYDLTLVTLSFEEARTILLDANYTDDFHGWSLHKPLFGNPNPLYSFDYGTKTVTIDTVTQQINETPAGPLAAVPGAGSVSIEKIAQAGAEIRKINANAFIIWAGGLDSSGNPLNAASDTNQWDFYAVDNSGSAVSAWSLRFDGAWTVAELPVPPFGIEFWDISQINMDVTDAWVLAVAANYGPPYAWWSVFKPLNPSQPNPAIVFGSSVGFIVVDTVTGQVTVE